MIVEEKENERETGYEKKPHCRERAEAAAARQLVQARHSGEGKRVRIKCSVVSKANEKLQQQICISMAKFCS